MSYQTHNNKDFRYHKIQILKITSLKYYLNTFSSQLQQNTQNF